MMKDNQKYKNDVEKKEGNRDNKNLNILDA